MTGFLIFLSIVLVLVVVYFTLYNNLVRARNQVSNGFANIDVVLNKRYDLIPNMVEVARRYLKHESETFIQVTEARNTAAAALKAAEKSGHSAESMGALSKAENSLTSAIGNMHVVFESYPELKADAQMRALQEELANLENEVATMRTSYNSDVTFYNNLCQTFPSNMVSNFHNFKTSAWLEIEDPVKRAAVRETVRVDFS